VLHVVPRLGLALPHALYRTGFLLHEASHSVPPVSAQVCPIHRLPMAIISTVNAIIRTVIAISSTVIAIISTASCRLHEATDRSVRSPHSAESQPIANRLPPHRYSLPS
jgi:hypothetical protein